jgi:TPR repeat protein
MTGDHTIYNQKGILTMRFSKVLCILLFVTAGSAQASSAISQLTLDQTLSDAQTAVQTGDYSEAFALYNTAAHWGHKGAQYVLGELYTMGKGVEKDAIAGYAWLELAAEAPDRDFRRAKKSAGKNLSDTQMAQAEALALELSSTYGMEATGVSCKKEMTVGTNIKTVICYHEQTAGGDLIVPDVNSSADRMVMKS